MQRKEMPATFVQYAADILADTNEGLSGPVIVRAIAAYAVEYDVNVPHQHILLVHSINEQRSMKIS